MRASILSIVALLATACAEGEANGPRMGDHDPETCFVGDLTQQPEIQLLYRTVDGEMAPLTDGAEVPMILPPQGGKVVIIGFRARNVDICGLRVNAALRDQCSGYLLGRDGRPVFLAKGADGWAYPRQPKEISDYANIPTCPNFSSRRDADGEPFELEMTVTDGQGREVTAETMVTPVCGERQWLKQCTCECDADYRLGHACPEDAATDGQDVPGTCPPPEADRDGEAQL